MRHRARRNNYGTIDETAGFLFMQENRQLSNSRFRSEQNARFTFDPE